MAPVVALSLLKSKLHASENCRLVPSRHFATGFAAAREVSGQIVHTSFDVPVQVPVQAHTPFLRLASRSRRGKVRSADLHQTDYTPWEGHEINAWPVMTIMRGVVKVENGKYLGKPGDGRYLKRKIPADIIRGPML